MRRRGRSFEEFLAEEMPVELRPESMPADAAARLIWSSTRIQWARNNDVSFLDLLRVERRRRQRARG